MKYIQIFLECVVEKITFFENTEVIILIELSTDMPFVIKNLKGFTIITTN